MVIVESNCFNCAGGPVGKNRSDSDEFVGLEKTVENGYSQLMRMIHPALLDAAGVSLLEQRTTICGFCALSAVAPDAIHPDLRQPSV
jgi:hypothetical protein